MKKTLSLILVLILTAALLAGCAQTGGGAPSGDGAGAAADAESLRTLGDVLALDSAEYNQSAMYSFYYIYVFELDGVPYRAIAEPEGEIYDKLWDLDWGDEEYEKKRDELIAPLEIIRLDRLDEQRLPQQELDALVGKTGGELLDSGWSSGGWNLDNMEFWMNYGPFCYTVVMEGSVDNYEDFEDEDINSLVVKSVACEGIGDATNIELDDDGRLVG